MDVLLECGAGIDVAKGELVACVRKPGLGGRGRHKETRTFLSFTAELEAMADWFAEGVTEVVMEATGSYWKPVWYVLEDRGFELNCARTDGLGSSRRMESHEGPGTVCSLPELISFVISLSLSVDSP